MKKVILSVIFAVLITLAPSVKAAVAVNKSFSVNLPDGDKKKKKDKGCEGKKDCSSSSKKSCCSSMKEGKTEEAKPEEKK